MAIIASGYSATATTANTSTSSFIKDPAFPSNNLVVQIRMLDSVSRTSGEGVFYPLNSAFPVVVSGVRRKARSAVTVFLSTATELAALNTLLDSGRTLLLMKPPETATGPQTSFYFKVSGDVVETRVLQPASRPEREVTIPFVEVAEP